MPDFVIYGTTDLSGQLHYYVEADHQGKVLAFVVDRPYIHSEEFDGLPVIAYDELQDRFSQNEIEILVSLGYSGMNDNREAVFKKCQADGWKIGSFIHSSVQNLAAHMGEGNIILDHADLRLHSSIGDGNIIGANTFIGHDNIIGDFNWFSGNSSSAGRVQIGDHNFIGNQAVFGDHCRIGDYNLIGAGTCVSQDIGNEMVLSPAPARMRKADKRVMDLFLRKK